MEVLLGKVVRSIMKCCYVRCNVFFSGLLGSDVKTTFIIRRAVVK